MNVHLKQAFSRMKPVCDMVMINPSPAYIVEFESLVNELKVNVLQELHQYMLFPFITHLQSKEIETKHEMQRILVNGMKVVLQRVKVTSYEMCLKIEMAFMGLIFDKTKPGMVANVPEELKLSVMECLTVLMVNLESSVRLKLLQTQIPLIAQTVFLSVHMAKLEKLRSLRIASIESLNAHIACHKQLTDNVGRITDPTLEKAVVEMTSTILPGVLAALQDVAMCADNPGHAVIVAALDATHRILCLTMNDKHFKKRKNITADDFMSMLRSKESGDGDTKPDKNLKTMTKLSREWYSMAGEKLKSVMKSLVLLVTHEHYRVRKELAVLCYRILSECTETMLPSLPLCIEVLICLSIDQYGEVAEYSSKAVDDYFSRRSGMEAMESLCDNFLLATNNLPRVLNNIDSNRKLSALNSVLGYLRVLLASESQSGVRPGQARPAALALDRLRPAVLALLASVALDAPPTLLTRHATRDVSAAPPTTSPWCVLRHVEAGVCTTRLRDVCRTLGALVEAPLVIDLLLDELRTGTLEPLYLMNWVATSPGASPQLAQRLVSEYTQEEIWGGPLEDVPPAPAPPPDTRDVTVYDPRAWTRDSVPGLYEGATETRYTGVSYLRPRGRDRGRGEGAAAQSVLRRCLLAEGLGLAAQRLGPAYQPHLFKTLCPLLETAGSKYELVHWAGLGALHALAGAGGHGGVAELLAHNADYCTAHLTYQLKKPWSISGALRILSVVVEYSDVSILDYLYGVVDDVLVQSCDRYYQQDLYSYLLVFLTFVDRIRQWFPDQQQTLPEPEEIDILKDVTEFIDNKEKAEKLLEMDEFVKESGKTAEEMYREDVKKREEEMLDYDDAVVGDTEPLPRHVAVTASVIDRCIHFATSPGRDEAALALRVLARALPVLARREGLLPRVHAAWPALVAALAAPSLRRPALHLLVTLAELANDFIRSRAVKEVLPSLYQFLHKSSADSYLKDAGSAYRLSQAFAFQCAVLEALPALVSHLRLGDDPVRQGMDCAQLYLSRKQPKPLQELAVQLFKNLLDYNYGLTWEQLRRLCRNQVFLVPPPAALPLCPVQGTPYEAADLDYDNNIKLIFDINK